MYSARGSSFTVTSCIETKLSSCLSNGAFAAVRTNDSRPSMLLNSAVVWSHASPARPSRIVVKELLDHAPANVRDPAWWAAASNNAGRPQRQRRSKSPGWRASLGSRRRAEIGVMANVAHGSCEVSSPVRVPAAPTRQDQPSH